MFYMAVLREFIYDNVIFLNCTQMRNENRTKGDEKNEHQSGITLPSKSERTHDLCPNGNGVG